MPLTLLLPYPPRNLDREALVDLGGNVGKLHAITWQIHRGTKVIYPPEARLCARLHGASSFTRTTPLPWAWVALSAMAPASSENALLGVK